MIFEIAHLDSKLKLGQFGLKIVMCPIFMKFGTKNKSNMLIIDTLNETHYVDSKLQILSQN